MVGFIIIGPQNAVTYKEIFPLLKDNKMWWGTDCVRWFIVSEKMNKTTKISYNGETIAEGDRSRWWTNIPHNHRKTELDLYKKYSADEYPKYDNYDAIEVSKVAEIPMDYDGVMGVPITFLDKYCSTQFEILGLFKSGVINGKHIYARILIRRKKNEEIVEDGKKFLIIGNAQAITYKEIFPYIKNNELWLGVHSNKTMEFAMPNTYEKWDRIENGVKIGKVPAISWFTNIPHNHRNKPLDLFRKYNETDYPKYNNYDAIEVSKVSEIPMDYEGVMGVPITFMNQYNPNQFEVLGISDRRNSSGLRTKVYTNEMPKANDFNRTPCLRIGNEYKSLYMRLFIRRI